MGKYSDFPSQTQNLQFNTPKRDDEHPRRFYMGLPPPGPHGLSLLLGVISLFQAPRWWWKVVQY